MILSAIWTDYLQFIAGVHRGEWSTERLLRLAERRGWALRVCSYLACPREADPLIRGWKGVGVGVADELSGDVDLLHTSTCC